MQTNPRGSKKDAAGRRRRQGREETGSWGMSLTMHTRAQDEPPGRFTSCVPHRMSNIPQEVIKCFFLTLETKNAITTTFQLYFQG